MKKLAQGNLKALINLEYDRIDVVQPICGFGGNSYFNNFEAFNFLSSYSL